MSPEESLKGLPETKDAIREDLRSHGLTSSEASEIADLAVHASQRAMQTVVLTIESARDQRAKLCALYFAIMVVHARCDYFQKSLPAMLGASGLSVKAFEAAMGQTP